MIQDQKGMSLAETMMGMAAVGGILMVTISMNEMQTKNIMANRTLASRDNLRNKIERYLANVDLIRASARSDLDNRQGNVALDHCLSPPSSETAYCPINTADPSKGFPNCCVQTDSEAPQPFFVLDPGDPSGKSRISGTEAAGASEKTSATAFVPARFDLDGEPCSAAGPNCPIEVVTSYLTQCPADAARCKNPSSVSIKYQIRLAQGVTPRGGKPFKAAEGSISLIGNPITTPSGTPPGGGGGGGSATYSGALPPRLLRFTRTLLGRTSTMEQREQQCQTEFGSDYVYASIQEIAANWQGSFAAPASQVNDSGAWFITRQSGSNLVTQASYSSDGAHTLFTTGWPTSGTYPVACLHR